MSLNGTQARVEVLLYCDYAADGILIPGSHECPAKVEIPIAHAEHYVNNGLGEYCDVDEDVEGEAGATGEPGCAGQDGQDGTPGACGKDGMDGLDGQNGSVGFAGERGRPGRDSDCPGPQGPKGDCGEDGDDGTDGVDGINGTPGGAGMVGEQGVPGVKGETGDTGAPGLAGPKGMQGDVGPKGAPGDDGRVCPEGALECIEIEPGCIYRFISRDADCNIIGDTVWTIPKTPDVKKWCVETLTTINFDSTDYKTADNNNGTSYALPLSNGQTLNIDLKYGVPSDQPCRMVSCGYNGNNAYEDVHPNINAYSPGSQSTCDYIPMALCFSPQICGEISVDFYDVDESVFSVESNVACEEKIRVTDGSAITVSGDLVETSAGVYAPTTPGNSNADGSLTWTGLDATDEINFDVQLVNGPSMGFGLSGTQVIKTEETGTYIGTDFFDSNGEPIPEPTGWVDCT